MLEKRKLLSNSFFMLINRLTQGVTTLVLTVMIARVAGVGELGKYLLAFSYYFIFMSIVSQGLKTLYTRDLSRKPEDISIYLVNGTFLQFVLSFVGYIALVFTIFLLPYSADTSTVCYIFGLAIIPFSLSNITEAVFQSQEKMHLIAIATVPIYILRLFAMFWAMEVGYGADALAVIFVISEAIIYFLQWMLLAPTVQLKWTIQPKLMWKTLKAAKTFFVIDGVAIISIRLEILVLSLLGSEVLVGLYGGIMQLMQPFLMIADSVALATFPAMSKMVEARQEEKKQTSESIIEILLLMALPFFVGLCFFGGDLLQFIYSDSQFASANVALLIVAFSLLVYPFNRPLSYLLVANGFERINMQLVSILTVLRGVFGIILVAQYQLLGAAITYSLINGIAFIRNTYAVNHRLFSLHILQVLYRPLLISLLLVPAFISLQRLNLNFLVTLITATCIYCVCIALLGIYTFGGARNAWAKFTGK